jgi:hypothetical protein
MTKTEWKEFIVYGLGGFVLFLTAGYATVIDVISFVTTDRPLYVYHTRNSGLRAYNDLGIYFTVILGLLSIIGLFAFGFYVHDAYRKIFKK